MGRSAETSPTSSELEKNPQKYFFVTNIDAGIAASGYVPQEAIELMIGECFKISGFLTDEGQPAWAAVRAHDIAQSLGADGQDPNYWPSAWWSGYADAFKGPHGELSDQSGYVRIPLSNGEIFEAENDDQIMDFLESRKYDRP